MGNHRALITVLGILMIVFPPMQFAKAYEIYPNTSIPHDVSSSATSGFDFDISHLIPDSISGISSGFHAINAVVAQYTGMLSLWFHLGSFYTRLNGLVGMSLSNILRAVGGAFIWIINMSVMVLNFVSNLITGGVSHL